MTTSESKGRFFLQNESIRIDSRNESDRIDSNRELECSTAKVCSASVSCCRRTRATHCRKLVVSYTKLDTKSSVSIDCRPLQVLSTSGRMIEQEVRGSSAEGAEWVGFLAGGVPLPVGEGSGRGLCPLPRKYFEFRAQNGEIWCILRCPRAAPSVSRDFCKVRGRQNK